MTVNNDKVVSWFTNRIGKLTYSMTGSRNGSDGTADCSGSITQAIRDAGGTKYAYLYSTVTLATYLQENGYQCISRNQDWDAKKGDIVMCSHGQSMADSGGAGGHVGVMMNATEFISTDYWTGGGAGTAVSKHNWNEYYGVCGFNYIEVWRLKNEGGSAVADKATVWSKNGKWYTDQRCTKIANGIIFHMGAYYYFRNGKRVDDELVEVKWASGPMLYYFGKDGRAIQGTKRIGKATYNFGNDGTFYNRN